MIFDIEADGLEDATKIHVLAYTANGEVRYTHDYDEMRGLLSSSPLLIGHNIVMYDIPLIKRILGIEITAKLIDTLPLSWYLNHDRIKHGLDDYGKYYGILKPKVDDWVNLSPEEYAHRCVEDVKINKKLWEDLKSELLSLYDTKYEANRLLTYLTFKMQCARLQEESRIKADKELIEQSIAKLSQLKQEKIEELIKVMPKVKKHEMKTRPAKPFKKDGTWSVTGARWFNLLKKSGLPEDYNGEVKVVKSLEEPNPGSPVQVKDWLLSLGWKPANFKFVREDHGAERKIPQVRIDVGGIKQLCPSVLELAGREPKIKILEGLTVIQHRLGVFEGFRDSLSEDGYLTAKIGGLTNTLRFKHKKPLTNLPGVFAEWGKEIRGSLVARDGHILCGSDMSSLEENTKKHYMFPHDPEYVEEMSQPGFDAHLDLAKQAGKVTREDIDKYVNEIGDYKKLTPVRQTYKKTNYSAIYGIGVPKLSRETGLSRKETEELLNTYWERNWSIKVICDELEVKTIGNKTWLLNPVSKIWHSLRYEKDKFSTLNQSTGVWCFDKWLWYILSKREQLSAQFHDEFVLEIKEGAEELCTELLQWAIDETNKELSLNVQLEIDIQYGDRYSEIH